MSYCCPVQAKIAKSRIRLRVILRAGSALPGALSAQLIHRSHRSLPGLMTIRCWRPHGCRRASHRCDTKSSSQYCPGAIGSAPLSWRRANRPAAQQVRGRQEAEPSQQIPALAGRRDASQPDYASEARPLASVDRIPVASYACDRRIHSFIRDSSVRCRFVICTGWLSHVEGSAQESASPVDVDLAGVERGSNVGAHG